MKKYSVIVPLFNKASTIYNTIKSVLLQSYSDFELIIIDDGSTDDSRKIIKYFNDNRIKYFYQNNQGVSCARTRGITEAKGKYVCFLDAADICYENFIETIDNLISKYPKAGAYCTKIDYFYKNSKQDITYPGLQNDHFEGYVDNYFKTFETGISIMMASNICIAKEVFDNIGMFKPRVSHTEDTDMWSRIALSYPIVYTSNSCARYNVENKIRYTDRPFYIVESLQKKIDEKKVPDIFINSVKKVIEYQLLMSALAMILSGNNKKARCLLNDSRIQNTVYKKKKSILETLSFLPAPVPKILLGIWKSCRNVFK